ncbi:unnamed protein product [Rodentolepis nana]|uniref:Uncharacterized protein n=1 Tax=Rodentolepis nana TaxID=102285 RepID=A0A0R3TL09_RODNA|nr:unnamed protein product [Rodentolepis nana]
MTECLRLIRCRVATAAAYIQTDALPNISTSSAAPSSNSGCSSKTTSCSSDPPENSYYKPGEIGMKLLKFNFSENRVILEAVSRFENAYISFAGWLTELASLNPPPMEVLPVALGDETPVGQQGGNLNPPPPSTSFSKKSGIRVSFPINRSAVSSLHSPDSPQQDDVLTPDDVGEIMARGNACFLAIQTAAEV